MAARPEDTLRACLDLECEIRSGSPGDAELARSLGRGPLAAYGNYEEVLAQWLVRPDVHTLVAVVSGTAVGLAMLHYSRAGFRKWIADLVAIALEAPWTRRGIGRKLLESAERVARTSAPVAPAVGIRLDVAEDNLPARRLFESAGFHVIRTLERYYAGGQRALEMWKPLRFTLVTLGDVVSSSPGAARSLLRKSGGMGRR